MRRLPLLPSVNELIKIYGLSAKSALGQNYILNKNITDKIVREAEISPSDSLVVEVGPGPALLTRSILDANPRAVIVIEKDSMFLPSLKQLADASSNRLKIINGDVLLVPHSDIIRMACLKPYYQTSITDNVAKSRLHIIGNLPFNIATPLLIQCLKLLANNQGLYGLGYDVSMTLTFQKEVARRLTAAPSTHARGRLSVITQSYCDAKELFTLPSSVFVPAPKVEATVVQLRPRKIPFSELDGIHFEFLEKVVTFFFTMRRKSVGSILKKIENSVHPPSHDLAKNFLSAHPNWESNQRPENIATEQFICLTRFLYNKKCILN